MNSNNNSSLEEMYKRNSNANNNIITPNEGQGADDFQNEINDFNDANNNFKHPELIKDDEYKVVSVDINNNDNTNTLDQKVLLNSFIGENYPKIENEKFNLFAFLFGGVYLFYRKLFVVGIILQIIQVLLVLVVENYILIIIINVLLGLFFDKLYIYYAKYQIKTIRNENQDKTLDNLKFICSEVGGVNKKNIFIGILTNIGIVLAISLVLFILGFMPNISNMINKINSSDTEEKHDDAFSGIEYSENISIKNKFSISVPEVFIDKSSTYKYDYLYESTGSVFNDCKISIGEVSNYKDKEKFIAALTKYYESNNVSGVNNIKTNNINWNYFSYTGSFNTTYFYITNKNDKIYLLEYEIQNNAPDDCINYKDTVINSISFK